MSPITPISSTYAGIASPVKNYRWNNNVSVKNQKTKPVEITQKLPWLKDKALISALAELNDLVFDEFDINYLKNMGVNVPFHSGAEAVNFIEKQNVRIMFEEPTEPSIHAQYDFGKNIVSINKKYKNTNDFSVILAIAEAILHETGHANDNDGDSSIQEELDFLGMNAIAHRAFLKKYGNIFAGVNAPIVSDGVSVYEKLFFENDVTKKSLSDRMRIKYGDLPAGDGLHPPQKLATKIKNDYNITQHFSQQ